MRTLTWIALSTGSVVAVVFAWFYFTFRFDTPALEIHTDRWWPHVAVSPQGDLLAIGSSLPIPKYEKDYWPYIIGKGRLELRSSKNGDIVKTAEVVSAVRNVIFSPDGERVIASVADLKPTWFEGIVAESGIVIWQVNKNDPLEFIPFSGYVASLDISNDGEMMAGVIRDADSAKTQFWFGDSEGKPLSKLNEFFEQNNKRFEGYKQMPLGMLCFADEKRIALEYERDIGGHISPYVCIEFWNLETMKKVGEFEPRKGSSSRVLSASPNGEIVHVDPYHLVNMKGVKVNDSWPHGGGVQLYVGGMNADGDRVAVGGGYRFERRGSRGAIAVWSIPEWKLLETFRLGDLHSTINSIAYFPDGTRIATGSRDGTVRVWDLSP